MERTTPFYEQHLALGASMVPFAGWLMPLHYGSQLQEHKLVRENIGMFDVSHMGIIHIHGKFSENYLRSLLGNDVSKLQNHGTALYSCLLNYEGGILDDLITYKFKENDFVVIVNASQFQKDFNWFMEHKPDQVHIESKSNWSLIALQGPLARETLLRVYPKYKNQLVTLKPFHFFQLAKMTVACTGYTGEDGFEIMGETDDLLMLWSELQSMSVTAIGLGARDSLRLEAGLNLYGQDMDETTSPFESNLGWTIDFKDKARNFIGKEALLKQKSEGVARKLIGLIAQDVGILRSRMVIELDQNPTLQGVITSGSFSPILKSSIAFARIPNVPFTHCRVKIRDTWHLAQATMPPFVRFGKAQVQVNPLHP